MAQQQFKVTLKNPKTGQVFEGSLMGETEAAVRQTAGQRGLEVLAISPVGAAPQAPPTAAQPSSNQQVAPPAPQAQPVALAPSAQAPATASSTAAPQLLLRRHPRPSKHRRREFPSLNCQALGCLRRSTSMRVDTKRGMGTSSRRWLNLRFPSLRCWT